MSLYVAEAPRAFPTRPGTFEPDRGMTLRDYFAAKAMQALVANGAYNRIPDPSEAAVAAYAYAQADAMLKAREA